MKKILFVHHISAIGGASYCLLNLLKEVDREKYIPIVLLRDYGSLVKELSKLGIDVYFLDSLCVVPYNKSFLKLSTAQTYRKINKSKTEFQQILQKYNLISFILIIQCFILI